MLRKSPRCSACITALFTTASMYSFSIWHIPCTMRAMRCSTSSVQMLYVAITLVQPVLESSLHCSKFYFVSLIHSKTSATPACSAPDPEALLEALLARKLTAKMLVDAGKGQAQKWINDKLTPKESLLASMGAEDHDFMVILLTSNMLSLHIAHKSAQSVMLGLAVRSMFSALSCSLNPSQRRNNIVLCLMTFTCILHLTTSICTRIRPTRWNNIACPGMSHNGADMHICHKSVQNK